MEKVILLTALILLSGCAGHQDLLAPAEPGRQVPVNQQWDNTITLESGNHER